MDVIGKNFMLRGNKSQDLYHRLAAKLPIIDYHCHLDPRIIAENTPFEDMTALWLAGDHYKWRAMRANGVAERLITGDAPAEEKFKAWAETVEACLGNPLYHWTHLELKFYFNITEPLNGRNWREIWNACNAALQTPAFLPRELIRRANVTALCTTDSPTDSLEYHQQIRADEDFAVKVLPTFRPDDALEANGEAFVRHVRRLAELTGGAIATFEDYLGALDKRIAYFHAQGGRLSDHGLTRLCYLPATDAQRQALFARKLAGETLTGDDAVRFTSAVLVGLGESYARRGWAMQIHFGAIRNTQSRLYQALGANIGVDSIYDQSDVAPQLNGLLDAMQRGGGLPKTIVYNLDPSLNDVIASTMANFQSAGGVKSPMQFGAGWWFNDTRRGMLRQLTALADHGLLMNFVGMLTDSRSFTSYTRHDYFRRILCNLVGEWVENEEIPDDDALLDRLIAGVCYDNAREYFQF
ncbi:glucuronate isomerase [Martelella alba]|uniref:Uronate isomerase n=1 Tax=Martelella alba TaxID=2590451 RepID=A0ABY2SIY4_9HYPH|nr:glucuronate isomerase [Martelella alba]TKI04596.1 glucuronate isomerase [Martelella alba]